MSLLHFRTRSNNYFSLLGFLCRVVIHCSEKNLVQKKEPLKRAARILHEK